MTIKESERNIKICLLAFNVGEAGGYSNGPGNCIYNFIKIIKRYGSNINLDVFSEMQLGTLGSKSKASFAKNKIQLYESIKECNILHIWSGIGRVQLEAAIFAKAMGKKVIVGPNCLDTVFKQKEQAFMSGFEPDLVLTVNDSLKYKLSKEYNLSLDKISKLLVGPDLKEWEFDGDKDNFILWKGNSNHYVKDIAFALEVQKNLPQYSFVFLGYPKPYGYLDHIGLAKRAKVYFSTSISETMGLTLAEQWACKTPSVTHPKIHLHGENYKTGIITNKNISDYCEAIIEIMEDDSLYKELSFGAESFAKNLFGDTTIGNKYHKILNKAGAFI